MNKKGNLFALVKSMTRAEKRYFRLSVSTGNSNKNYLQLFDFIDKQIKYDDAAIKAHFQRQNFAKQLHVTKIYLNDLILRSLRNFHRKISKSAQVKDLVRDIEILFKKELFDQCQLTIAKALNVARKYEIHTDILEILAWKKKLILQMEGHEKGKESVNEILKGEKEALDRLTRLNQYWDLTINLFDIFQESKIPDDLLTHALLRNPDLADTFQSRILYHHILYALNLTKGVTNSGEKHLADLIDFLEQNPEFIREDPSSYITALNNNIAFCLRMKRLQSVPGLLAKIKAIPQTYSLKEQNPATIKLLLRTYNVELELYRDTEQYQKGVALVEEVSRFLEKYQKSIPLDYQLLLYYQFAYFYFMTEEYRNTLHWLNEIFKTNFGALREDIQSFAHLLSLITQFELGHIIVLKYAVDSCRRFLKKKRNLYPFEKVLLRFFSKISMSTPDKYPKLFQRLRTELFSETSEEVMNNALDYLNFETWITKKLRK